MKEPLVKEKYDYTEKACELLIERLEAKKRIATKLYDMMDGEPIKDEDGHYQYDKNWNIIKEIDEDSIYNNLIGELLDKLCNL